PTGHVRRGRGPPPQAGRMRRFATRVDRPCRPRRQATAPHVWRRAGFRPGTRTQTRGVGSAVARPEGFPGTRVGTWSELLAARAKRAVCPPLRSTAVGGPVAPWLEIVLGAERPLQSRRGVAGRTRVIHRVRRSWTRSAGRPQAHLYGSRPDDGRR